MEWLKPQSSCFWCRSSEPLTLWFWTLVNWHWVLCKKRCAPSLIVSENWYGWVAPPRTIFTLCYPVGGHTGWQEVSPVQICGSTPVCVLVGFRCRAEWWLFVLLDKWQSSPGKLKESIFSTLIWWGYRDRRLSTLLSTAWAKLQKWSCSGLNVTRIKTRTSPLHTILYRASQHV